MSEQAAQYEKLPCKICGGDMDREFGSVCSECLGFSRLRDPIKPGSVNVHLIPNEESKPTKTDLPACVQCSRPFEPYKVGPSITRKICYSCLMVKKYGAQWADKHGTPANAPARPTRPDRAKRSYKKRGSKNPTIEEKTPPLVENTAVFPPLPADAPKFDPVAALKKRLHDGLVVLDFSPAPEVLAWLKEHHENVPAYLMALIFEDIPSEVVKLWMLDRLRGISS